MNYNKNEITRKLKGERSCAALSFFLGKQGVEILFLNLNSLVLDIWLF